MDNLESILTSLGAIIPIIAAAWYKINKLKREKNHIEKLFQSNSFAIDFKDLNAINRCVQSVFQEYHVSRFLLISAVNGKDDFNFISVLYEQHNATGEFTITTGATSKYINLKTDQHYKNMLKFIEKNEPYYVHSSDLEPSQLKQIYESDKVKYSLLHFLNRIPIDKENDRLLFCSWATHLEQEFNYDLQMRLSGASKEIAEYLK